MDELKQWYREALVARIKALEASRKELKEKFPEAIETIRRIAHSLRGSGGTYGYPKITDEATILEEAEPRNISTRLDALLAVLYEVTSGTDTEDVGILIIDDDPEICKILEAKLGGGNRKIYIAEYGSEAEKILQKNHISLILLDLILPDTDGRNLLLHFREQPETAGMPIIVLSAQVGARVKMECYALGANDFFEKPLDPDILSAAVASRLSQAGKISTQTHIDSLTKLPNRAAFNIAYSRMLSFAGRVKAHLSLAILDIDHFKNVNDSYGHLMGDEVLRRVAKVMSRSLRQHDILARWGGEEFIALLPNTDRSGAVRAIEKALLAVTEERFESSDGKSFFVTFSAGVTEVSEGVDAEDAVAEADRLLYLAKSSGRNRVLSTEDNIESTRKKILFAEDDNLISNIIKHRLKLEGFDILHFIDGSSAFTAAQETIVDLAIIDVKMPEMDGFELLRRLRMLPGYSHIPILMLTSMGSERDIARGFKLGADDYVLKPFSIVELLARIHRMLTKI